MKTKKIIRFTLAGKKYTIKDYKICSSVLSKARGLMFRRRNYSKPLLFVWKKPGLYSIHSFFCRKFLAIWMLKGRIIDVRFILPQKLSVTPKEKFDELLEIPLNSVGIRNI